MYRIVYCVEMKTALNEHLVDDDLTLFVGLLWHEANFMMRNGLEIFA